MLGKISRRVVWGQDMRSKPWTGSEDGTEVPRGCEGKRGSGMEWVGLYRYLGVECLKEGKGREGKLGEGTRLGEVKRR
jgi:hypothetical protein